MGRWQSLSGSGTRCSDLLPRHWDICHPETCHLEIRHLETYRWDICHRGACQPETGLGSSTSAGRKKDSEAWGQDNGV